MSAALGTASLIGVLDEQLHLLRELSAELNASRSAYVSMDIDKMYQHIAAQTAICNQLRETEEERKARWREICEACAVPVENTSISFLAAGMDPAEAAKLRKVVTELALAEGDLRNLNRAHSVLIEGSRRTLNILANVLASFAPMYSRPVDSSGRAAPGAGVTQ